MAELGDEHEVYTRLKAFLDSFRTQYMEVADLGDNSETMDRLYGDCTEVLHSLLDYVHRELKLPAASDAPGGVPADPTDADAVRAAAEASRLSRKRVMELVPEALRAAELILRDKRYVQARWVPGARGRTWLTWAAEPGWPNLACPLQRAGWPEVRFG